MSGTAAQSWVAVGASRKVTVLSLPHWVFQATCVHQVLSSANRAVPSDEQEALGKDDLLV